MHILYGIGFCLENLASSTLFLFASHTCFLSRNCLAHSVSPCSSRNFMAFVSKPLVRRAGRSTLFSRQRANRGEGLYCSSIAGQCRPDPHVLLLKTIFFSSGIPVTLLVWKLFLFLSRNVNDFQDRVLVDIKYFMLLLDNSFF